MKINQNNNVESLSGKLSHASVQHKHQQAASVAADTAARPTTVARDAGVPVAISSSARSLDENVKSSSDDIDMAKVQAMRAAIANGTFRLDASVIADRLLADTAHLLGTSARV